MMYDLGQPLTDAEFQNAIVLLDTDGNGKLSYAEFKAWWGKADRYEQVALHGMRARVHEGCREVVGEKGQRGREAQRARCN